MRLTAVAACALLDAGSPVLAQTDLTDLTAPERAVFGAEIRALLLDDPQIVAHALDGPSPYAEAVNSDLAQIAAHRETLFADGAALAIITGPECSACATAMDELRALSDELGITFSQIDSGEHAGMIAALGLESVPSYVLPDMMVRGHVPPIVLRRYLTR